VNGKLIQHSYVNLKRFGENFPVVKQNIYYIVACAQLHCAITGENFDRKIETMLGKPLSEFEYHPPVKF